MENTVLVASPQRVRITPGSTMADQKVVLVIVLMAIGTPSTLAALPNPAVVINLLLVQRRDQIKRMKAYLLSFILKSCEVCG